MLLSELALKLSGEKKGEGNPDITGVGDLKDAEKGHIIYISKKQNYELAKELDVEAFIVSKDLDILFCKPVIVVDDPKLAFLKSLQIFYPPRAYAYSVSNEAHIDPSAILSENITIMHGAVIMAGTIIEEGVVIYPNVVIEPDAKIGRNTKIYPNAVIGERCIIGCDNIIYAGVIIGGDGFGYHDAGSIRYKIPQTGIVRTGCRVEIGSNTTIDRATIGETFIDDDTKIDNLCQIAHNCIIGKRCFLSAQVGLAGSCTIGDDVIMAGQVGLADHITIGNRVLILAQSGVPNDLKDGEKVFGYPARPLRESHRINAALTFLPDLVKRMTVLEKSLEELKGKS